MVWQAGQESPGTSIGQAMRDADSDKISDRVGDTVVLQGVLTTDPYLRNDRLVIRAYLQDGTGGVRIRSRNIRSFEGLVRGDEVRVSGRIGHKSASTSSGSMR